MDASAENLVYRACSLVARMLHDDLENITSAGSTVQEGIILIDCHTVYESFDVAHWNICDCQFACLPVKSPKFDSVLMHSDKLVGTLIEELHVLALLLQLIGGWTACFTSSL